MKTKYVLKRINAYIIDYIIFTLLAGLFVALLFPNNSATDEVDKFLEAASVRNPDIEVIKKILSTLYDELVPIMLLYAFLSILYYVILTKKLKSRTLGCVITGQVIVKDDRSPVTLSDLTARTFLTNGGLFYVVSCVIFVLFPSGSLLGFEIYALFALFYFIFLVASFIVFLVKKTTLADLITKTRPLMILVKR